MYEMYCVVTRSHYWILGKNVDLSGSPSGCARRTPLAVVAFGVLSVWWKTGASVSTLFRAVLPQPGVSGEGRAAASGHRSVRLVVVGWVRSTWTRMHGGGATANCEAFIGFI